MNPEQFIKDFHDYMAPTLDMYEQAIYLYLIRHSRLLGEDEVVVCFKSARKKMAFGVGQKGTPPSEGVIYDKVKSLAEKKYIELVGSERSGSRIRPFLPEEINGLIVVKPEITEESLEEMNFFTVEENRKLILEREKWKCFYCNVSLNEDNYVMEHVVSRSNDDNSFRNIVASCRTCNNKKGSEEVSTFVRNLYRNNIVSQNELEECFEKLGKLENGELQPIIGNS